MLKIKAMLVGGTILLAAAAGLWMYINHLQSENEVLTANNAVLEDAADRERKANMQLLADTAFKDTQIEKRNQQLADLRRVTTKLQGELRETETQDIQECLTAVPSDDFINRLREYSEGQNGDADPAVIPEPIAVQ